MLRIPPILFASLLLALLPASACHRPDPVTEQRSIPEHGSGPVARPASGKEAYVAHLPAATSGNKTLYLTFDADMTPGMLERERNHKVERWYSPGLVDYLIENHIEATVFSTGMFAEDYPVLMSRLASSGLFSIQNHTYDHSAFSTPCYGLPTVSSDVQKTEEMRKATEVIRKLTGQTPTYLRHPGLCHKAHDVDLAEEMGLKISDTGTISGDPFAKDPQRVAEAILRGASHNPVIILHLGGPNAPATEAAVQIAIPKLQAAGYIFAKME